MNLWGEDEDEEVIREISELQSVTNPYLLLVLMMQVVLVC